MQQHIVPTSPKSPERQEYDAQKQERKNMMPPHLVFVSIICSLIFGALSGFLGFLIVSNIPSTIPILGKFNIISFFEQQRDTTLLSTRHAEKSIVQQSPQVIDEVAVVYSAEPTLDAPAEFLGNAIILTSDGWMVTSAHIFAESQKDTSTPAHSAVIPKSATIILPNGAATAVDRVLEDPLTGLTFLKVSATNLSPVYFDEKATIPVGQLLSSIEKNIGSYVVYEHRVAGESHNSNTIRSTSSIQQYPLINTEDTSTSLSSPIFYNNGNIAGMLTRDHVIIPGSVISGALQSILQNNAITHSAADIEYINVSRLTTQEQAAHALNNNGFLITNIQANKNGADKENDENKTLQKDDVILSINNALIDSSSDLSIILHSKPANTIWYMKVLRDGIEKDIQFTS